MKPVMKSYASRVPLISVGMVLLLSTFLAQMTVLADRSVFPSPIAPSRPSSAAVNHDPSVTPFSTKSTEANIVRLVAQTTLTPQQKQASQDAAKRLLALWTDRNGYSGYYASTRRSDEIRRALNVSSVSEDIAAGADVNARSKDRWTALMEATAMNKIDVVKVLIHARADVDARDYLGETALDFAAVAGYADIMKALLNAHANVDAARHDGQTALMWALMNRHGKAATVLIDAHANVNAKNDTGETALMLASSYRDAATAKLLIDAHANVNAKDHDGTTALILAAQFGDAPIVKMLIRAGADVNAKQHRGLTVLDYAEVSDQTTASKGSSIAAIVKAAGAR